MLVNTHPHFASQLGEWEKFRLTYFGGKDFVLRYLQKFSDAETDADFETRKTITYCPAIAKAALNDVLNPIYQRLNDIERNGGPESYQKAVVAAPNSNGVDLTGSSMNTYVGKVILPELLMMGKMGVFVDMPQLRGITLADNLGLSPYLYYYAAENILNWEWDISNNNFRFTKILLREYKEIKNELGFVTDVETRFRHMFINELGTVTIQILDESENLEKEFVIKLKEIPFAVFDIGTSLLKDIADYQIALLNLESSDIAYLLKSNVPFFVEKFNKQEDLHNKGTKKDIKTGTAAGRRYPKDVEYPQYVHPSSEPIQAAMEKEEQIKKDVRLLINLAITNIQPKMASAASKGVDNLSLEAGLSKIGLTLEAGERKIAQFWADYLKTEPASVKYPLQYDLKNDEDRNKKSEDLLKTSSIVPSITFKREAIKKSVQIKLGNDISDEVLQQIYKEVDASDVFHFKPDLILKDVENGLITTDLASKFRGYPAGEAEKAKQEHAERLQRIAESQSKARGITDLGGLTNVSEKEKEGKEGRGDGT